MSEFDEKEPDGPLTSEEEAQASLLSAGDLERIDKHLLSEASHSWRKVARVIAGTMGAIGENFPGLPDVVYARRVKHLVDPGALEAAGNLDLIRFSEVRIPDSQAASE